MAKNPNQKLKLLYLMKILLENTDEDHGMTMPELIASPAGFGISAERKSLYDDIEALRLYGLDIERTGRRYFVADRIFELPELKLLVDAVQSSRFITHKKSTELIKKVESLASQHQARLLQRQVYVSNRVKAMNESIYYNIDKLHTAISQAVRITFRYFEWTIDFSAGAPFQKQYRHGGAQYLFSPWALTWDDENYYLVAYDSEAGMIKHYRVDKMDGIALTDLSRDGQAQFERFDMAVYARKIFGMFGGEEETVKIRFSNRLAGVVADRFGRDAFISRADSETFYATVSVAVSPQFLSWVFGFGGEAKIVSPPHVARQLCDLARMVLNTYLF